MENNNLNPENEELRQNDTEINQEVETVQPTAEPEAGDAIPEQNDAPTEVVAEALVGDNLTVIPEPQPPVKKSKVGLFVGIAVALVAVAVVVGVSFMGQTPEKVVTKAVESTLTMSMKQNENMMAELPMLAKTAELETKNKEIKAEVKLNSLELPDVSPIATMMVNGTTISGTTISIPSSNTYSNSYSLNMMGQNIGTINLYTSPTIISMGLPEFFANSYYLDVDRLAETGMDSYLFGEVAGASKEDLQTFADMYKAYITSLGSLSQDSSKEMYNRMKEICAETLTGVEYASIKVDGQKRYTATIPAQSLNDTLTAVIKYIYLESPVSGTIVGMLPGEAKTEFEQQIATLADEIAGYMPITPTVITMNIVKGSIGQVDIVTEGTTANDPSTPMIFKLSISDLSGANCRIVMNVDAGSGATKMVMDMTMDTSYADKVMKASLDMKVSANNSDEMIDMVFDYSIDGNKESDNLGFNMVYDVNSPSIGTNVGLKMSTLGDYYVKDDAVVMALDDIDYNIIMGMDIVGSEDVTMNMNFGMTTTTLPYAGELTPPEAIDMLTLNAVDIMAILDEGEASLQKLLAKFLGNLA